jgi:hypothetical protein
MNTNTNPNQSLLLQVNETYRDESGDLWTILEFNSTPHEIYPFLGERLKDNVHTMFTPSGKVNVLCESSIDLAGPVGPSYPPLSKGAQSVLDRVLESMLDAEEMGVVENLADYQKLMTSIVQAAAQRLQRSTALID